MRGTRKGEKNTRRISEAEIAVSMMKKVWYYERKKFTNRDLKWVSIYVNFHRYTKLVVLKNIENLSIQEVHGQNISRSERKCFCVEMKMQNLLRLQM